MIIKIKSREECLEAGFRRAISLYDLDIANMIKNNNDEYELLDYLPDDIFDTEQMVNHIETDITGKCYYVNSGWAISDIFVKEIIGELN